ncbi:hypothetical protein HKCCE2091_14835 [Rhodobacterales bacterium HKCCE2091]|nr:hypothetical protein [Rhodobacterales bacterium HKCCE2091]
MSDPAPIPRSLDRHGDVVDFAVWTRGRGSVSPDYSDLAERLGPDAGDGLMALIGARPAQAARVVSLR